MNLSHLKYAAEVGRTGSITKAAENLFMGQPALSRAIKELEEEVGLRLFKRTAKGIAPTLEGERFLTYAQGVLNQVALMESMYKKEPLDARQMLSVSAPRASYIACAMRRTLLSLDTQHEIEINYKETNAMRAINNIINNNFRLSIIRYQDVFETYYLNLLKTKNMHYEDVWQFHYVLLMSRSHPLANKERITLEDLNPYICIMHGDPYVPTLPMSEVKQQDLQQNLKKRVLVYERGSQFDLLCDVPDTYMWVSPIPQALLDRYGLVQRACAGVRKLYKDVLIYQKSHRLTSVEERFLSQVKRARDEVSALPIH